MQYGDSPSDLSQNLPNASLMYSTYTPTFGNIMFQIQPSRSGQVSMDYGTIPYLSLESLIYMQQMQAQTAPTAILPGQNTGQQNIQGQYSLVDGSGNMRVQISANGSF